MSLCECGCGGTTPIAADNRPKWGRVKGQHVRFIQGHNFRLNGPEYELDPETGCWVWQRAINPGGYGVTASALAHRAFYERFVKPIPEGLHIDHLCRNRSCVNPAHLEAVTQAENNRRSLNWNREKTHCKRGHEFTPENTYLMNSGSRSCRTCQRIHYKAWSERQQEAIAC